MTETPPAGPLNDTAPPAPRRRYRREWLVWIILLLLTTLFVALQTLGVDALHKRAAIHARASSSVPLRLLGEYAVGLKHMQPDSKASSAAATAEFAGSLDQVARNPVEDIRTIPVIGELQGAGSALKRIQTLLHNPRLDAADRLDLDVLDVIYKSGPGALSVAQRQRLLSRHGWFARLALSYGLPDSNPQRHAVIAGSQRAMLVSAAASVGGIAFLAVGFVLLVVAVVLVLTGRLRSAFREDNLRDPAATQPLLETVALFLVTLVILDIANLLLQRWTGHDPMPFIAWLVPLVLFWPGIRGLDWQQARRLLGWHTGRGIFREIGAGLLGYLAGLPLLMAGAMVSMALASHEHVIPEHPVVEQIAHAGTWQLVGIFLLLCVWAPLMEESIFRGALFCHLRQRWAALWSALFSGLLFASLHPQGWVALPPLMALGFTFAMIREWRGSILPSATAHALNNGLVFLLMVTLL